MGQAKVTMDSKQLADLLCLHPWEVTRVGIDGNVISLYLEGSGLPDLNDKGKIAVVEVTLTELSVNDVLNLKCSDMDTLIMLHRSRRLKIIRYDKI